MLLITTRRLALIILLIVVIFYYSYKERVQRSAVQLLEHSGYSHAHLDNEHARPRQTTAATTTVPASDSNRHGRPKKHDGLHKPRPTNMADYMKKMLDWERPTGAGHWPPYNDFVNTDYDPNRWEAFDMETGYYSNVTVGKSQSDASQTAKPYLPYPRYNTKDWRRSWKGSYSSCAGPRGIPLSESTNDLPKAYHGLLTNFPGPFAGSHQALGLDDKLCFDRYSRYGAYGLAEDEVDTDVSGALERHKGSLQWNSVQWGKLQDSCLEINKDRYRPSARKAPASNVGLAMPSDSGLYQASSASSGQAYKRRTAVLIRTWQGYHYTANDIHAIRALVTELSLLSGGEYQVFLFVNLKDRISDVFRDAGVYEAMKNSIVPQELQDMAILWHEDICHDWYPEVGDWQVYWNQFMPVQWFSRTHPEFDFIWNWEMDARYIGNHYYFLEKIGDFARQQKRKLMWERNTRYYFPNTHGSWDDFYADTKNAILDASAKGLIPTPVWGAQPYAASQTPLGPKTPGPQSDPKNENWGVGEEADLITLLPLWDPRNTSWVYRKKIWNFVPGVRPEFSAENPTDREYDHPSFDSLPRITFINTVIRFSARLLNAMHEENRVGRTMQAEMWPGTVALHHGFKAIYVPHPIWADRVWPPEYADGIFNADGGRPARWTLENDSVYAHDRGANFRGWSWCYSSTFPEILYRRWLGWEAQDAIGQLGGEEWEKGRGRMCLPAMLLHPVKRVEKGKD